MFSKYVTAKGGDDGGEETAEIERAGNITNPDLGGLREISGGLWGTRTWNEMRGVATCPLDAQTAADLRLEYRSLPSDARAVVGKLLAAGAASSMAVTAGRAAGNDLTDDLDEEAQASSRGRKRRCGRGARGNQRGSGRIWESQPAH